MRSGAARMNDPLWNSLMIEMRDFFTKDEILQQGRAARIGLERVLIVGNRHTLIGCEPGMIFVGDLVLFAAASPQDFSV
jgi:hypothetical protein